MCLIEKDAHQYIATFPASSVARATNPKPPRYFWSALFATERTAIMGGHRDCNTLCGTAGGSRWPCTDARTAREFGRFVPAWWRSTKYIAGRCLPAGRHSVPSKVLNLHYVQRNIVPYRGMLLLNVRRWGISVGGTVGQNNAKLQIEAAKALCSDQLALPVYNVGIA